MNTGLAKIEGGGGVLAGGLIPRTIPEAMQLSVELAKTELVPEAYRGKPANILLAILYGLEVGLPPVAALRCLNVIKGKVVPYADTLVAIVLGSGKCKYFKRISSSDTEATYETMRVGDTEPRRETFTIEDAKRAGLLQQNQNYLKYPRKMLEPRAKAFLCRDAYPDVCAGISTAEEVIDMEEYVTDSGESRARAIESQFSDPAKGATDPSPSATRAAPANDAADAPPFNLADIKRALDADEDFNRKVYGHVIVRSAEVQDRDLYDEMSPERHQLQGEYRELAHRIHKQHKGHLGSDVECDCDGWAATHLAALMLRGAK